MRSWRRQLKIVWSLIRLWGSIVPVAAETAHVGATVRLASSWGVGGSIRSELRIEARADEALRLFRVGPQAPETCTWRRRSPFSATRPPGTALPAAGSAGRSRSSLVDQIRVWHATWQRPEVALTSRQTTLFLLCISAYPDLNPCVHGDHEPPGSAARAGGGWSEILGSERASLATSGERPMGCAGSGVVDVSGWPRRCRCMLVRG